MCDDQEAVDLVRNVPNAQDASKLLVDHALSQFSTDNLSCMVIRFDENRLKEVVNGTDDPIGVDGDPPAAEVKNGVSEAEKIIEGAQKSMAHTDEDPESVAEETQKKIIRKMEEEEPGPELTVDEQSKPDSDSSASTGDKDKDK